MHILKKCFLSYSSSSIWFMHFSLKFSQIEANIHRLIQQTVFTRMVQIILQWLGKHNKIKTTLIFPHIQNTCKRISTWVVCYMSGDWPFSSHSRVSSIPISQKCSGVPGAACLARCLEQVCSLCWISCSESPIPS